MWRTIEFIFMGYDSSAEIAKIRSEISEMKELQKEIQADISELSKMEKTEQMNNYYSKWVVGGTCVAVTCVVMAYFFYCNGMLNSELANSLGDQTQRFTQTIIDRITSSDNNANTSNAARVDILTQALERVEQRLVQLMNRLSDQIARTQDNSFGARDFFDSRRGN